MAEETPRRRWRWVRWLILILVLLSPYLILWSMIGRKPKIEPGSVLVVRLAGEIDEGPSEDPLEELQQLFGGGEGALSLHEIRRGLRHAQKDNRIVGVLLEIQPLQAGWGTIDELRTLITDLRQAGKPVQALLSSDFVDEREYLLATAAGRVVMAPEGGLMLNGMHADIAFFRGLLDNLKIQPEVLQLKEYKSAFEPLVNKSMSPAMREWVTSLVGEIHGRFLSYVATQRKIDTERLAKLMDRGVLTSKEGLAAGLIDAVGYRDELEDALAGGKSERKKRTSLARYVKALPDEPKKGQVALIYAVGPILAGSDGAPGRGEVIEGPRLARTIREAADDEHIKAIVMRVNSGGGSAVGSDMVWREIERIKSKKPVVVSMGDVAGSGGYWISMNADAIVAQPATITGSIGVVFPHFNVLPLWQWTGGTIDGVKFGQNADIMSSFKNWTPEQRERILAWMQHVYDDFVARVAKGRKLPESQVEPMAHGRVWTGSQAKERKLVDELGGLEVALRIAREKAKLPPSPDAEPVVFPRQRGLLAALSQLSTATRPVTAEALMQAVMHELAQKQVVLMMPSIEIR
jgi:protease-4